MKNRLWKWVLAASVVAVSNSGFAADSTELAKRLHHAAEMSSLDDPALEPWHLKLDVQLYDDKGQPSEKGTIEEWWTPEKDKRVYATPSYTATEIRAGKAVYRSKRQPAAPYLLNAIRRQVIHPMASAEEIDHAKPELRVESFGKVRLDCVVLDQRIAHIPEPSIGLFPTYCLDQDKDRLRLTDRFGSEASALDTFGTFQGRKVAVYPTIGIEGRKAVEGHVALLESKDFDPSIFVAGPEMEESGTAANVQLKEIAGNRIKVGTPVYPAIAKAGGIDGAVHIAVMIGTDGCIHDMRIIDTPDKSLALSALASLRQWKFKPYLVNGIPVEVNTILTVNFQISGPI